VFMGRVYAVRVLADVVIDGVVEKLGQGSRCCEAHSVSDAICTDLKRVW
jgi:hypothetical protein